MGLSKTNLLNSILIALFLLVILATNVSAETTFFDNPDDAFIMGNSTTGGVTGGITGGTTGGGGSGGGGIDKCAASWNCTEWSECINGARKRECTDLKPACNKDKPKTTLPCKGISESKKRNALFDIDLKILKKSVNNLEKLVVSVSLINLGIPGTVNARIDYQIKDKSGKLVKEEREVVPVETQKEFIKEFSLQELKNGKYILSAELIYEGQKEPARSEEGFEIGKPGLSDIFSYTTMFILIIIVILAVFLVIIFYRKLNYACAKPKVSNASRT